MDAINEQIDPASLLSEHELDALAVARARRYPLTAEELLARGAMRSRRPVFAIRMARGEMLARLEKLGVPPWRETANGQRLDQRSDQYLAERLHMTEGN
jgi:hypothetical protein